MPLAGFQPRPHLLVTPSAAGSLTVHAARAAASPALQLPSLHTPPNPSGSFRTFAPRPRLGRGHRTHRNRRYPMDHVPIDRPQEADHTTLALRSRGPWPLPLGPRAAIV